MVLVSAAVTSHLKKQLGAVGMRAEHGGRVGLIQGSCRFPGLPAPFPTFLNSSEAQVSGQNAQTWNKGLTGGNVSICTQIFLF